MSTSEFTGGSRRLPSRPNLEYLRSQAKRKLAEIRRENPDVKLHEAQLQLAREYGFASWRALKSHLDSLARASKASEPLTVLGRLRQALGNPGNPFELEVLLKADPALVHSHPWSPDWEGTALEGIANRCVWHRPRMHEMAKLLVAAGASADLPLLARCGLRDAVSERLNREPQLLNEPDPQGGTALYRAACVYGAFPEGGEVVDLLLSLGAEVDIWTACTLGMVEVVAHTLHADPTQANTSDPQGMKPLHWACRNRSNHRNETAIVELLCRTRADLAAENPTEEHMQPLHHCGEWMTLPETAAVLLEHGADLNAIARGSNMTPLDYAISRGRHPMIAFLTERGARRSPGSDDRSRQFLQLISHGEEDAVQRTLLADPELINRKGPHPMWGGEPQPLHVAIERNHAGIFCRLLDGGADVDGKDATYDGWSPLLLALHHRRNDMRDCLLARGARIGLPEALLLEDDDRLGEILSNNPAVIHETMPSLASVIRFARTMPALKLLIEMGAPLGQRDRYGATPVESIAIAGGQYRSLVEYLVQEKAPAPAWVFASLGMLSQLRKIARHNREAVQSVRTATAAIESGQAAIVAWLLREGLSPKARAEDGSRGTLLHSAAWAGNREIAKMLIEAGANPNAVDEEYRTTPVIWAETALERLGRENCRTVIEYLQTVSKAAR